MTKPATNTKSSSRLNTLNPRSRFSNRVDYYVKYRPRYPEAIFELLVNKCGLTPDSVIADIGSGTGFLAELFLGHRNKVYGVEPNAEMRQAGEAFLEDYPNFKSIDGAAEATTLESGSVDFVTAGQAFHWFEPEATQREFERILRKGGWTVLVWNDRNIEATRFLRDYEALLHNFGTDYGEVQHKSIDEARIAKFLGHSRFQHAVVENKQHFDFEGLRGRLLSSSYVPPPGDPVCDQMLLELKAIFDRHKSDGRVEFLYETNVYFSRF